MANKRIYDLTLDTTPDQDAYVVIDASSYSAPVRARVRSLMYPKSASAPTTGSYEAGDHVWHIAPSAGGYAGWICIAGGSPGSWLQFGLIETP